MGDISRRRRDGGKANGRLSLLFTGLGLLLCIMAVKPAAADFTVTAQTTECNGDTGFASFESSRLFKIQEGPCPDPGNPDKHLKQVLLKSEEFQFSVLWVTEEESRAILDQIKEVRSARLKKLSNPDVVVERTVVEKTETKTGATPEPSKETASIDTEKNTAASEVSGDPPKIEMIDPPIGNTRSMTQIITAPDAKTRTLVGKVQSGSGVLSVTINGEQQPVNEQGIFTASVPVKNERTPISIVAVDKTGRNSTFDMELIRKLPDKSEPGSGGNVFGRYHALIIANTNYENMVDLATPANDARDVAALLRDRYGFEVTTLFDATRYDMLTALNDMRRTLTDKDNLLIYYAGHGAYDKINNRGHWLPVDAEADSTANWISTVDITDIVNAMSAMHVLVVADSCYSGALSRSENTDLDPGMSAEMRDQFIRTMAKAKSRHVLTSGGVKPVVDDAGNGHSVFANAFITTLEEGHGAIEGSEFFQKVEKRAVGRAHELSLDQTPQYAQLKNTGHEFGEFILVASDYDLPGQSQSQTAE